MNQPSLPTKTKIAAWTMILIGSISLFSLLLYLLVVFFAELLQFYILSESPLSAGLLYILLLPSIYLISPALFGEQAGNFLFNSPYAPFFSYLFLSILLIFFGLSLLKRKRWSWWGTIFFLLVEVWFITYQLILAFPGENAFIDRNPSLYISGILLILLTLDKKNY